MQGRGVGTALLAPVLAQCDRTEAIAYTETQKEEHASWYARSGFAAVDEVRLAGSPARRRSGRSGGCNAT